MTNIDEDWDMVRTRPETKADGDASMMEDIQKDWNMLQGLPETGYLLLGVYWHELALWKVRLIRKVCIRGRRNYVAYETIELLWSSNAKATKKELGKRYVTQLNHIDSNLIDAVCRLQSRRDENLRRMQESRLNLQENLLKLAESIDDTSKRIREVEAFVPSSAVPSDLLEAEDREIDAALEEARAG